MACKCLIFDWDGTLVDSASRIVACLRSAAEDIGLPELPDEQLRHIIGLSLEGAVKRLYPGMKEKKRQDYGQAYREHYMYKNNDPSPLFAEVETMLATWQEQGYYLAVATGKSRIGLKKDLTEHALAPYFYTTKTADETAAKPDPLMLREILLELDISANEAIMIGDTRFDIDMAKTINMHTVGLAQGAHPKSMLEASQPTILLDSIQKLPTWIAENHAIGESGGR